ncbi:MAG: FmdB family transcriptional regulator [Candidatus Dormibacteraeota bacterium]|nr:FmdB family transcriptional regulator [Candidatus Dormibacteraeota bacterium]
MPTYGYRCTRGHHWEIVQRITEAPLTQCPECGTAATRVFYPVGIVFKGQGFYKTDSRGSGGVAPGKTGEADGGKDGQTGKEAAKTDTKAKVASDSSSNDGGGKADGAKADGGKADAGKADKPSPAKTEEKSAS